MKNRKSNNTRFKKIQLQDQDPQLYGQRRY